MQINIWELIEPLNAGKFGQSKRMHEDVDAKGENVSFPGKDGRKESRQAKEGVVLFSKKREGLSGQTRRKAK